MNTGVPFYQFMMIYMDQKRGSEIKIYEEIEVKVLYPCFKMPLFCEKQLVFKVYYSSKSFIDLNENTYLFRHRGVGGLAEGKNENFDTEPKFLGEEHKNMALWHQRLID